MTTLYYRGMRTFDTLLDKLVIDEVLGGKSYPAPPFKEGVEIQTIVDFGAHVGSAARLFHERYPQVTVHSYEPSPEAFALLVQNAPDGPQQINHNVAVGGENGYGRMVVSEQAAVMNVIVASESTNGSSIPILGSSTAFLDNHPQADIVKLDTEGHEVAIMQAASDYFQRAKVVYVEFHRWQYRLDLEVIMATTHILWHANWWNACQAELCWIRKDCIKDELLGTEP